MTIKSSLIFSFHAIAEKVAYYSNSSLGIALENEEIVLENDEEVKADEKVKKLTVKKLTSLAAIQCLKNCLNKDVSIEKKKRDIQQRLPIELQELIAQSAKTLPQWLEIIQYISKNALESELKRILHVVRKNNSEELVEFVFMEVYLLMEDKEKEDFMLLQADIVPLLRYKNGITQVLSTLSASGLFVEDIGNTMSWLDSNISYPFMALPSTVISMLKEYIENDEDLYVNLVCSAVIPASCYFVTKLGTKFFGVIARNIGKCADYTSKKLTEKLAKLEGEADFKIRERWISEMNERF